MISKNNSITYDENFGDKFSKFITYSLRGIIGLIILASIILLGVYVYQTRGITNIVLIPVYALFIAGIYFAMKNKVNKRVLLLVLTLLGLVLRLIWVFSLNNTPVSDFDVMYQVAHNINNGDYSAMKGYGYIARFPHLTIIVLYFAKMLTFFKENTLIALKIVNVIASTLSIVVMHYILDELFNDYRRVVIGTFLIAVIPASILYTAVYCGENISILFFLISVYLFLRVMNKKNSEKLLILCGLMLFVGHLFRMVGQIIIISYIMFILIYYNSKIIKKVKCISYILISFMIPFMILSNMLVSWNITDQKLNKGSETHLTSFLRGSNMDSYGRWNPEDAEFVMSNLENTEYLEEAVKDKIIYRYTHTNILKLASFVIVKVSMQWCFGDFDGVLWSQNNLSPENYKIDICNSGRIWYQLFYIAILIMIFKGLFNRKEHLENKSINLFYIIFCGYGCTFLLLESQARYGFIIYWVFIILALVFINDDTKFKFKLRKNK